MQFEFNSALKQFRYMTVRGYNDVRAGSGLLRDAVRNKHTQKKKKREKQRTREKRDKWRRRNK